MCVGLVGYLPVKGYDVFLVCPSALVPYPAHELRGRACRSTATSSICSSTMTPTMKAVKGQTWHKRNQEFKRFAA